MLTIIMDIMYCNSLPLHQNFNLKYEIFIMRENAMELMIYGSYYVTMNLKGKLCQRTKKERTKWKVDEMKQAAGLSLKSNCQGQRRAWYK